MGANLVFMLAVIAWVGVFAVLIFGTLSVSGRAKLFTIFFSILIHYDYAYPESNIMYFSYKERLINIIFVTHIS